MPLYKEAPAPPRGPEPVFGPPPPAKISVDEAQDKLPQPLRMITHLLDHAIITPVFDSLFGVSGLRETAPQPISAALQAQVCGGGGGGGGVLWLIKTRVVFY